MSDSSTRTRNGALVVIAGVVTAAALANAHWFFVPVALGLTLAAVLYPVVRLLRRWKFPAPLAATAAVLAAAGILFGVGVLLEPPISAFASQIPRSVAMARTTLAAKGGPFARVAALLPSGSAPGEATPAPAQPAPSATSPGAPSNAPASSSGPSVSTAFGVAGRAFGVASSLLGDVVEVVLLAVFILGAGDAWREKLSSAVKESDRQQVWAETIAQMRGVVGRYFVVTLIINAVQAAVIAIGLMLLGFPSPALWGALTFLLEFIPYIGGLVMVALLFVVGLAAGQSLLHAVAGPALYFAVTTLQNNLVSPIAYGRGLRLNPAAILLALVFFWGLWGVAGAFLAVPMLAAVQVYASRTESLCGVAAFLGD